MKKMITAMMVLAISFTTIPANTFANEGDSIIPISAEIQIEKFAPFTGKVIGITQGDKQMAMVEATDGTRMQFVITADTYKLADVKISQGSELQFIYDLSKVDTSGGTPKADAVVASTPDPKETVYVGRFTQHPVSSALNTLVSRDNSLIIRGTGTESPVTQDGKTFFGSLVDQKLLVVYSIATKSLPAQTTPTKVVVLNDSVQVDNAASMPIVVNGTVVETTGAFTNDDNVIMVPVRPIAAALGYEITWESDTKTVRLGNTISFQVGKNEYTFAKMGPIKLHAPSVIMSERTYVPLDFFSVIVKAEQVTATEGHITINMNAQ